MGNTESTRSKWDSIYSKSGDQVPEPCWVLKQYEYLLPGEGKALDVASGRGGNALFLASRRLKTTAVDISSVGLSHLQHFAKARHLEIETRTEALSASSLGVAQWDVIVVSAFLQRDLCDDLALALNAGGLLFYETFVHKKSDPTVGPGNPAFLLDRNELLRIWDNLSVRVFVDLEDTGDCQRGLRNRSCLIAQKL